MNVLACYITFVVLWQEYAIWCIQVTTVSVLFLKIVWIRLYASIIVNLNTGLLMSY
jgi:hypothetical protein